MKAAIRKFFSPAQEHLYYLALAAFTLAVYFQSCFFDFIWDDHAIHLCSNHLLKRFSHQDLMTIWTTPYKGLYVPLSYTVWGYIKVMSTALSGKAAFYPSVFHGANVLLHVINACLVFRLLRIFFKHPFACFLGALLFAIHPLQVESVAWCSELRSLLSGCFGFAALLFYLSLARRVDPFRENVMTYGLAIACFILALYAKPSAVVIPLIAAIIDYFVFGNGAVKICMRLCPFAVAALPFVYITVGLQALTPDNVPTPLIIRPLIWTDALNFYFLKLLLPLDLVCPYMRTPISLYNGLWLYFSWIPPVLLTYVLFRFRKSQSMLWTGYLVFVAGFLPVSGLIPFFYQSWSTVADRYLYISMFGVALVIAYLITRTREKYYKWALVLVLLLGVLSACVQLPVWRNPETFWTACLEHTPGTVRAYFNRGNYYAKVKEYDLALADFERGVRTCPNSDAYYNIGNVFLEQQLHQLAIQNYDRAIRLDPKRADAYANKGLALFQSGQHKRALACYDQSIRLDHTDPESHYNRGNVYALAKQYEKAIVDYNKALSNDPDDPASIYRNRATAFIYAGKLKLAEIDINHLKAMGTPVNPVLLKLFHQKKAERNGRSQE